MTTFAVHLPTYEYSLDFDRKEFTETFPQSMITLALQSREEIVPIENPMVTPEVLQLLKHFSGTQEFPYIRDDIEYLRVLNKTLDYLDEPT